MFRRAVLTTAFGLLLPLALACSQQPPADPAQAASAAVAGVEPTAAPPRTPVEPPPRVDTSISSVPVEDIVFDTFRGGFIRLSEASGETIEALRDRIEPIYDPKYGATAEGDWLGEGDNILGYVSASGAAYAYPTKILNFHEIVNDVIDGVPVLVSYCPLCASGVVYDRKFGDDVLLFGNTSALYESDLVMYDHTTGSYWHQVIGEAIVGPLTGSRLEPLPSMTTTWGHWKEQHPETLVLSRDLGLLASLRGNPYSRDPFVSIADQINKERFAFPVTEDKLDNRLRPGDMVLALQVGQDHKAYLLTGTSDYIANDEVAGEPLVVLVRPDLPAGFAYFSAVGGRRLTFQLAAVALRDIETGSLWDEGGRAISGNLEGAQLELVPSRTSFWFSIVGALPGLAVYEP